MNELFAIPTATTIEILHSFSRALVRDEKVKRIEGIAFLSNWLRKENLKRIIETNIGDMAYLERFVGDGRKQLRAFPRGLVCHWIAGNIPTLGLFSLFQSMLAKNGNILRIPEQNLATVLPVLQLFAEMKSEGCTGQQLLRSIAVVYFPSDEIRSNKGMSSVADARVVWGGKEAVEAITGLPHTTHCEDVVFGPKYSFSVVDAEALTTDNLERNLRHLATDAVLFEQTACSSPHVIFVETNMDGLQEFAHKLSEEFKRLSNVMPKQSIDMGTGAAIINKRAEYALSKDKMLLAPKENDWTILIDSALQLEEPIQSRTIFLKPVNSVLDTVELVTRNVQTIGNCIRNQEKAKQFAEGVMFRGVARVVPPGQMHIYDSPWDGILLLNRLVRWNTLTFLE